MNHYILIRRLRGPAFLLLVGVIALLAQMNILGWGQSWPLFLILAGVLILAERAALAAEGYPSYPGAASQGAPQRRPWQEVSQPASEPTPGTAIVPSPHDFGNDANGGRQ